MEIEISQAETGDLDQLADLLAELFTLENDFRPDREKQLRGLRLILDSPALGKLFVLRDCGSVAGMANLLFTVSTAEGCRVAVLEDVIIRGEYRGNGLGRRLVEHVLAWAEANGIARITLLADRDNEAALGFYRRLGFCPSRMVVLRKSFTRAARTATFSA